MLRMQVFTQKMFKVQRTQAHFLHLFLIKKKTHDNLYLLFRTVTVEAA
jgi:hypothetical protein